MNSAKSLVAVVENDTAMLKALERLLRASGYRSELYASAELFLARSSAEDLDCMILDIDLGGINGLELQRSLVNAGTAPPIIFVTSQADAHYQQSAHALGCLAYLKKPFTSQELLAVLPGAAQYN